jgi:hypothetical protein
MKTFARLLNTLPPVPDAEKPCSPVQTEESVVLAADMQPRGYICGPKMRALVVVVGFGWMGMGMASSDGGALSFCGLD